MSCVWTFIVFAYKMHKPNDGQQQRISIQMGNQKWIVTVICTLCCKKKKKTSVTLKVRNKIKWTLNTQSQSKYTHTNNFWILHTYRTLHQLNSQLHQKRQFELHAIINTHTRTHPLYISTSSFVCLDDFCHKPFSIEERERQKRAAANPMHRP